MQTEVNSQTVINQTNLSPINGGVLKSPSPLGVTEPVFNLELRSLLYLVKRNTVLIATIIGVALLIGLVVTMVSVPRYSATAKIQIDQQADRILEDENAVQPEVAIQDADRFLRTQVDILQSRSLSMRVAKSLNLIGSQAFFEAMGEDSPKSDGRLTPERAAEEGTLKLLRENLSVELPRDSRVVAISFESPDAELAAKIANVYAREYIANNLQRKFNSSDYAREFLSRQLAEAKERLEESERELNEYSRSAGIIRTGQGATDDQGRTRPSESIVSTSLVQLNEATLVARADRIAAEGKWRSASGAQALALSEVLANPAVQQLLQQRATVQATLEQERARYFDDHPSVKAQIAQLEEINNQLSTLSTNLKNSLREQYRAALLRESELAKQVEVLKAASQREQQLGVQYGILSRETDTNRIIYDGMLQRYKEISAAAGISANNVSLVDEATAPILPSSPDLVLNLALALLGGLAVSAIFVTLREQLDDIIRVPDEIEQKLGIPVLGSVPMESASGELSEILGDPKSSLSEAYSALRTALLYSTADGLPRSISVTSTQAGEGKTTTSFALSVRFASLDKRVLLISADLRRPSLHNLLGLPNERGLADLLTSDTPLSEIMMTTSYPNLDFVASGPISPNPTELLGGPRLRKLIEETSRLYDVVIVDGPPVLGLADAPQLASVVSATIFVIESNRGSRGETKSALRRLRSGHATIIGALLTKVDRRIVGQNYGYYDYDYTYDYGSSGGTSFVRRKDSK